MGLELIPTDNDDDLSPRIAVIGVGGAGGNAIANMMHADVQGVNFFVANTDAQALKQSPAEQKVQLGTQITQGLGAGSKPEIGRAAAEETIDQVSRLLEGSHMCFIAAGMGGGTGTGAAPVIAKAARDMGILTVGVVTKPFAFEGNRRAKSADAGIEELQKHVDTLIVIPNQNLFLIANANTTFKQAFEMADEVLKQGVRGITDLMVMPGLINLDFADVRSVMQEMGKAMMGTGEADGDDRALIAAQKAIANPLLDGVSMQGAKGVIISITGGEDMRLLEVDEAANHIRDLVDPDANIIWGSAFNPELEGKIRVSVVATGIEAQPGTQADTARAAPAEPQRATFSFSAPKRPDAGEQATAAPTPMPTAAPAPAPTPAPAPEPQAYQPPRASDVQAPDAADADTDSGDELLLGTDAMLPGDDQGARSNRSDDLPQGFAADGASRAPQGGEDTRRRFLSSDDEDDAPPQPRVKMGGTLFERMQNATRGARPASPDEREGGDLPRFLNRQNDR